MQVDGVDMRHLFCGRCGTRLWTRGDIPEIGGRFVMVFIPALDEMEPAELIVAPVTFADGAHDDWLNEPAETRHL